MKNKVRPRTTKIKMQKKVIVPVVNHTVLFFLFAFDIFYSFDFLLFGRHATRVGSVEKHDTEPPVCCPFSCLSMKTVSQVIPKKKFKLRKAQNKLANEKRVFSAKCVVRGGE